MPPLLMLDVLHFRDLSQLLSQLAVLGCLEGGALHRMSVELRPEDDATHCLRIRADATHTS